MASFSQSAWCSGYGMVSRVFALSGQERVMFQWMVLFAVGRLAALNLGSNEAAGAGSAQTANAITPRRVFACCERCWSWPPWYSGPVLASNWLNRWSQIHRPCKTASPESMVGSGMHRGWLCSWRLVCFYPFYIRVWREMKKDLRQAQMQDGPSALEAWLAIIDGGDYAQSWETAAAYFQRHISKEEWVRQLEKVRRPLGKVRSRKLSPTKFAALEQDFGAKFATSFDGLPAATETVTFARQARRRVEGHRLSHQTCGRWKQEPPPRSARRRARDAGGDDCRFSKRRLSRQPVRMISAAISSAPTEPDPLDSRWLAQGCFSWACIRSGTWLTTRAIVPRNSTPPSSACRLGLACCACAFGGAVRAGVRFAWLRHTAVHPSLVFAKANGVTWLQSSTSLESFGWKPNAVQATWAGLITFLGYAAFLAWLHAVLMRFRVKALFEQQRGKGTGWLEPLVVILLALFAFAWIPYPARTSHAPEI